MRQFIDGEPIPVELGKGFSIAQALLKEPARTPHPFVPGANRLALVGLDIVTVGLGAVDIYQVTPQKRTRVDAINEPIGKVNGDATVIRLIIPETASLEGMLNSPPKYSALITAVGYPPLRGAWMIGGIEKNESEVFFENAHLFQAWRPPNRNMDRLALSYFPSSYPEPFSRMEFLISLR